MSQRSAIVIGSGVIGTACAYYLAKSNWRVTILDQATFGSQCSHGNCGLVSPSHVLPLAMPGAIRKNLGLMLRKNSPFYIKPRFDAKLAGWLIRFALRCRHNPMIEAGQARHAILKSSRTLYDQLVQSEGLEAEFETRGCLFVYKTATALDTFAHENNLTMEHYGVSAEKLGEADLLAMEPALKPGLAGAWYYASDAHLRPDRLMKSWRAVLERIGVRVLEDCQFDRFELDGNTVTAVHSTNSAPSLRRFTADQVVVATGALTPLLERQLKCKIPIQPGKGYSLTMDRPTRCPTYPILCPEHKLGITPMQSGYRLGSTMEFSGYDTSFNQRRLNALREGAAHYLHEPTTEPIREEWFGWRPMTYDGVPIIDRAPGIANVLIAAGHNMLGLSMAPGTGQLVAEILNDKTPHVDRRPYRVDRF